MKKIPKSKWMLIILFVASVGMLKFLLFSVLALSDIYKGVESDLSAEWWVLRITVVITLIYVTTATTIAYKFYQKQSDHE